ncbi:MAG: prepilin-type N-terminal cleavage/methylation domain-containing protein [Burkholderiales bacterium]|uniref:type II secretion system protein n=1 Tax=Inhella sp. TaxID=1921806 RepID=UPI001AD2D84E|nr:prepilin-type N-terminal cleavage/methylation domain-containing protein [Burkholderiales bacterium]
MSGRLARGFTLVELILVLVIVGVMAGMLVVFLRPAVDGFTAQRARGELHGAAEAALSVLQRDVRRALPNSLRTPGGACFELIPTIAGGRYRRDADVTREGEAVLDPTQVTTAFDVLGAMNQSRAPVAGDWVVVGNQSANDAYTEGINRAAITDPNQAVDAALGSRRIAHEARQFPQGYAGGRFFVVPQAEPSVFFVCSDAGLANGQGTGSLYRVVQAFQPSYPSACPVAAGAERLVSRVSSCSFQYDPGALAEYGLLQMRLQLTRDGETVSLQFSSMVSNVP